MTSVLITFTAVVILGLCFKYKNPKIQRTVSFTVNGFLKQLHVLFSLLRPEGCKCPFYRLGSRGLKLPKSLAQ